MSPFQDDIDLEKCFTSGQVFRFRRDGEYWVGVDGDHVHRFRQLSDGIEVQGDPETCASFFRLDWHYGTSPVGTHDSVIDKLTRLGPELAPFLGVSRGLRLLRPSCPRETLFSFLCTSNNHLSRITQMVCKLAAYGAPLPARELHSAPATRFPSLERLAEVTEQELRDRGFGYRAKTIPLVARELLARGGEPYLSSLRGTPYQEVFEHLLPLPGVGPKLADCIALYALDKTEATPIDVHMWRAACPVYFPQWIGAELTDTRRRALADLLRARFGTLAGLAQQILFYSSLVRRA